MNREKVKGSEDSLLPGRWRSEERFKEPPESFDHRWDWPGSKSSAEKQSTLILGVCVFGHHL